MDPSKQIEQFLAGANFAVVGASKDRSKYGNKVFRAYLQKGMHAFPVNPRAEEIEGHKAYPDLSSIPSKIDGVSVITPPAVTESVVDDLVQLGIKHIWMQPGSESDKAIQLATDAEISVIASGPCLLVALGFREQ